MDWKNQKVLVTGADGFIGGWLAKTLVDQGADLIALVRDEKKNRPWICIISAIK